MIRSVQYRQRTFLGSPEWQIKAWNGCCKELDITLYGFGFELGALKEDCDTAKHNYGKSPPEDALAFVDRFSAIDSRLDAWFEEFKSESSAPLFWEANRALEPGTGDGSFKPLIFSKLSEATTTLGYWALKLVVSQAITEIGTDSLANTPSLGFSATDVLENTQTREEFERYLRQHGSSHCLHLAENITRSMPYVLGDYMGLVGVQQALFPLRTALSVLNHYPGEDLSRCEAFYAQFDEKKGLHYSTRIAK